METPGEGVDDLLVAVCSTPFGIRDGNTTNTLPTFTYPAASAQRLSASEMETPGGGGGSGGASMCSTPFGIRDGNTCWQPSKRTSSKSAQRLSASEMETLETAKFQEWQRQVLNAFRHQRWKHSAADFVAALEPRVLNAFRHQRWKHPSALPATDTTDECSTPFGIRDGNTLRNCANSV